MADQQTIISTKDKSSKSKHDGDRSDTSAEESKRTSTTKKEIIQTQEQKGITFENTDDEQQFNLDELHKNLIIISKIPAGYKLAVVGRTLVIDNTYMQSVTRWVYGDDRLKSMAFINDIVDQTFFKINEIKKDTRYITTSSENQNSVLQRFNTELKNSIGGLINLKTTYNNDESMKASIDVLIENITVMTTTITQSLHVESTKK